MPISKGTAKVVAYKKETTWGQLAGATGGKQLRRVTADFNLEKETYESNEIRTDRQTADFRHGVRSAAGNLSGELSPKTYSDFMAAVVARDFSAVTALSGLSVTIAASGDLYTVTRSAGSFIADGIKVGNVVRLTGAGLNTNNSNKNLLVVSMTATVLTVKVLNGTPMVAEGPIASVGVSVPGKQTYVPKTGHTDDSFTVEQWFGDIAQSEVYTGMKVGSMAVSLPATGLTTVEFSFMGKDLTQKGTTQYFTSPTAQGTEGIFAAVNGAMVVNGQVVGLVTSADFTIERALENATVVGSNSTAEVFTGRITATGNLSAYFQDANFRNYFDDETPVSIVMALTTNNTAASDFVSFVLPKVKLNGHTVDDGELGLTASVPFQALLNDVTNTGLIDSTVMIQDSTL
jgi:hypothetical protein